MLFAYRMSAKCSVNQGRYECITCTPSRSAFFSTSLSTITRFAASWILYGRCGDPMQPACDDDLLSPSPINEV
jgi:hypothetical protein